MNLYEYFKANDLISKVGRFELIQDGVKNGGNSNVLFFKQKNGQKEFAVKFLTEQSRSEKKLKRFIDEYFALIQLPPHKNIVKQYHLDSFEYPEENGKSIQVSYIIMKRYSSSLKDRKKEDYDGFKILEQIGRGLKHLHDYGVIHRDIKPENIFYDDEIGEYVIGDFGIAHFDEEFVARVSKTDKGERLANFSFSPEELMRSGGEITPASDIYSLGQVIQWWYTGSASKGTGRPTFGDNDDRKIYALNQIVEKSIQSDISKRFENLNILFEDFEKLIRPVVRNIYAKCYDLDHLFRASFPTIRSIYEARKKKEIDRFVENINKFLHKDEFWWMDLKGGDNLFKGLIKIDEDTYLLNQVNEIKIDKIIAFSHDSRFYKNFFLILTKSYKRFTFTDGLNNPKRRLYSHDINKDRACLYKNQYMDPALFEQGYIEIGDNVEKLEIGDYWYRERNLSPYIHIVCPQGAGPSSVINRAIVTRMLNTVLTTGTLDEYNLKTYLSDIEPYHSTEFRKWD